MKRRRTHVLQTTLAELTTAYYEAALAELGDERMAERVAAQLVMDAMRQGRFGTQAA